MYVKPCEICGLVHNKTDGADDLKECLVEIGQQLRGLMERVYGPSGDEE